MRRTLLTCAMTFRQPASTTAAALSLSHARVANGLSNIYCVADRQVSSKSAAHLHNGIEAAGLHCRGGVVGIPQHHGHRQSQDLHPAASAEQSRQNTSAYTQTMTRGGIPEFTSRKWHHIIDNINISIRNKAVLLCCYTCSSTAVLALCSDAVRTISSKAPADAVAAFTASRLASCRQSPAAADTRHELCHLQSIRVCKCLCSSRQSPPSLHRGWPAAGTAPPLRIQVGKHSVLLGRVTCTQNGGPPAPLSFRRGALAAGTPQRLQKPGRC